MVMGILGTNQTKKILFVTDDFLPAISGAGVYVQLLSRKLQEQGYQPVIVTSRRKGQPEEEQWNNIRVIRLPSLVLGGFPQVLTTPSALVKLLQKEKPDIVHLQYLSWLTWSGLLAGKKLGLPVIYTYHFSVEVILQPWFMWPYRSLIRRLAETFYNGMTRIIAPSRYVCQQMADRGLSSRTIHITNPVSISAKTDEHHVPSPQKNFSILYVGRLAPEKNIKLLIHAAALLRRQGIEFALHIAGDGPLRTQLNNLVAALGLETNVTFLGHMKPEQLTAYYTSADVFVLPSVMETLSLVAIEAMSFGKPLIVTDRISCATELVEDGKNGFIVDAENAERMAEKLKLLASDISLRDKMAAASLSKSEFFSPENVVRQHIDLYRSMGGTW